MKRDHSTSPTGREVPFLVCESQDRWIYACRRFIAPFQHATTRGASLDEATTAIRFNVMSVDASKIRAMVAGLREFALFWECSSENLPAVALTIAQIGVARPDGLQLAAVRGRSRRETHELSLQLMSFGISAAIDAPEQLSIVSRQVRRHFSRAK